MTTITMDEITRNAVLAALDERAARLEKAVSDYEAFIKTWGDSEDTQRALVWNIAALHETRQARDTIGEAEPTPEQADDITAAKAYHDWQSVGPR